MTAEELEKLEHGCEMLAAQLAGGSEFTALRQHHLDTACAIRDLIALRAEVERLRRLDAEYGRVEAAIIMADAEFDGDSDHANCGDRLIASVERLQARAALAGKGLRDD